MQRRFRFDYDEEHDSLFLYREKSQGSVELGNLILDFNRRKELVGLEILDASRFLQSVNVSDAKVSKRLLSSLSDCRIDLRDEDGLLVIKIVLSSGDRQVITPITLPSIREQSPLAAET